MKFGRASVAALLTIVMAITGCSGSATVTEKTTYNLQTGATTVEVDVSATWNFGGPKAHFTAGNAPSGYALLQSVPASMYLDSSTPLQMTFTATTDTGYTSAITVTLQPSTTSVAPVNQGDVMYAWTLPDTADVAAWEQQVTDNTTSQASLTAVASSSYVGGAGGTRTITTIIPTPDTGTSVSASSTTFIPGGSPGKCPNAPGCPVQPL